MAATSTAKGAGQKRTDPSDLTATPRETAKAMRDLDARQKAAYEEGQRNGDRPGPEEPDSVHAAFDAGYEEYEQNRNGGQGPAKGAGKAPAASGTRPSGPAGSVKIGEQGASFILGLLGYALVINYLRFGWPGVTGWLSAKFTNTVTITASGKPAPTATTSAYVTPPAAAAHPAPAAPAPTASLTPAYPPSPVTGPPSTSGVWV